MRSALALVLASAFLAAPAQAQSASDGAWAVTLKTQSGDCVRSLSSSIKIVDGKIDERGLFAQISGAVDDSGRVALRVARGSDHIAANGKVIGARAQGVWTAPARNCAGTWVAMRV